MKSTPPATEPPPPLHHLRLGLEIVTWVLLGVLVLCGLAFWWARSSQPHMDGTLRLAALEAPVTVVRDSRGIPHITAQNIHDLYVAQGYVMAQDRLWQMDLMRRLGEGRLAEVFGPVALETDRKNRALGLGRTAAAEAARLDPREAVLLEAFSAGVNGYIGTHRYRWPPEFWLLRYQPEPWQPRDSLALAAYMYQVLASGYEDKLTREALTAKLGTALAAQAFPESSPWDVPPGAPPPPAARSFGGGGRGGFGRGGFGGFGPSGPIGPIGPGRQVSPPPPRRLPAPPVGAARTTLENLPVFNVPELAPAHSSGLRGGSNDWVLSGARSFTGKPILANDPHLQFQIPGLWWAVQLTAPGLNVEGVAISGVPGVIIGHNDHIAWGVTNTRANAQDLYRETLDGKGDVATPTGWQPLQHWHERILVKGAPAVNLDIPVTRHGPIITHDDGGPLALDWTMYAPGALQSIHIFLAIDQAQNWTQFEAALAQFPGPAQNFVYADDTGHIAYQCAGWIPLRQHFDGALPVEGATAAYDWHGWIPFAKLPQVLDPAPGMLATANSRITPDNYPYTVSTDWDSPNRTRRIYQLLGMLNHWNASAMGRIQTDVVSEQDFDFARALMTAGAAAAAGGAPPAASLQQALLMLRGFNGAMNPNSLGATLAYQTRQEFLHRVLAAKLGDALARQYDWDEAPVFEQWLLANRPAAWLPPEYSATAGKGWDALLLDCLKSVVARTTLQPDQLRWGKLETLSVNHPVWSQIPLLRRYADLGPVEIGGSPLTVKQARNVELGDPNDLGPSMRFVADVGAWDRSTLTLVAGESGRVFTSHYRDEFEAYLRGRQLPLWFTPRAVAAHRAHTLRLVPASN